MHRLEYSDWQSGSGEWNCNDVKDLAGISGYWWIPARMMDMTPAEFVKWLVENYHPDKISFNGKTLLYSWSKEHYSKCHKFVLDINSIARKKNFIC